MRLTAKLVRVAAVVAAAAAGAAGCGNKLCGDGNNYGTCPCPTSATITSAQACRMIEELGLESVSIPGPGNSPTCGQVCQGLSCGLPDSYLSQAEALNPDAGAPPGDGGLLELNCPTGPATMTVTCSANCTGRLTEGYRVPDSEDRLASMAYLEAVSVHAFERLERELRAHGAPPSLLREAQRARRDEVRHTAMTARLARERGGSPRLPEAPAPIRARTLLEVALENGVEGCVRETYGAVQGLIEAQISRDRGIRRAMKSIAADECRHAELAWSVHAWAHAAAERERATPGGARDEGRDRRDRRPRPAHRIPALRLKRIVREAGTDPESRAWLVRMLETAGRRHDRRYLVD